jgi:hypothetical protein
MIVIRDECSSPLEPVEDRISIGDNLAIIEHKSVINGIVVRHVDQGSLSQLLVELGH